MQVWLFFILFLTQNPTHIANLSCLVTYRSRNEPLELLFIRTLWKVNKVKYLNNNDKSCHICSVRLKRFLVRVQRIWQFFILFLTWDPTYIAFLSCLVTYQSRSEDYEGLLLASAFRTPLTLELYERLTKLSISIIRTNVSIFVVWDVQTKKVFSKSTENISKIWDYVYIFNQKCEKVQKMPSN